MVQREVGQLAGRFVIENFVRLSRDHDIDVIIINTDDIKYEGKLMDIVTLYGGVDSVTAFAYLKLPRGSHEETHALINVDCITSMAFVTEKGILDNLID